MRPLRLAADARVVAGDTRGIGRYARAILRRLIERDDVELTLLLPGPFPFLQRAALARALDGSQRFALRSRATGVDLVWHPANGTFFGSSAPSVATIHDAIAVLEPSPDPRRRKREQEPILRSARTAARVVTDSAFARDDLHAALGIPLERIEAIHLGVDALFTPGPAQPLPPEVAAGRYLLFVGPIDEPRKNFSVLYQAYRAAWPSGGPSLVVLGPKAPQEPGIVHVASASDEMLRALYRGALALALPAYHEAFGLPLIEAMACGTPVIAARASALPEIGADAAVYVVPHDPAAWSRAIARVLFDPGLRERMREAGIARAAQFSWDACALRHLELFREVAGA